MTTNTNDPVFQAIRRDYRSRVISLAKDRECRDELMAQLDEVTDRISHNMAAMSALETFAVERNWNEKDFR